METYNCIIVDDSEIDRLGMLAILKKFPQFRIVGIFSSPEKALSILNEIQVDILFLDIEMPGFNGLELRKKVHEVPVCIFITNSPKYAVDSFEQNVLDYLLKPLNSQRFTKTAEKIEEFMDMRNKALSIIHLKNETFFLKNGTEHLRLKEDEILYLESSRNYTWVVTENDKKLAVYSLKKILADPAFKSFIRIHKSFAISPSKVHKILNLEIILDNGIRLPVGKMYRENLKDVLASQNL